MSRRRLAITLAMASGLVSSAPAVASGSDEPQAMIDRINAARAKHGVPALRHHGGLSRSAARFAGHMLRTDAFGHAERVLAGGAFTRLGELLARHNGRRPRGQRTVVRWLRSPWHRALLLDRRFRFAGAGRVHGRLAGRRSTVWVVQLGAR
jgi:uncharacterized protein YkwD